MRSRGISGALIALAVACFLPGVRAEAPTALDNDTCFSCHSDPSASNVVDPQKFQASVHSRLQCTGCHTDIKDVPHDVPLKPVSCSQCHRIETEVYLRSDHGLAVHKGVQEAASCRDCHGNPHEFKNARQENSPVSRGVIPETCGRCHGQTKEMAKFQLHQAAPVGSYLASVHGKAQIAGVEASAVCTDCHGSHDLHRATNPESKLFWQRIPATCGKCHENIQQTFLRSVHGESVKAGKRDAPVCTDCHGEHTIAAVKTEASKVFPSHVPETCGQCHAAERITTKYQLPPHVMETYMDSFHGLALQLGSVTAANCASCHGAHDILPSNDPRSSVNPMNLAQTCGRCHAGVSAQVAKGQIHSGTQPGLEHRVTGYVRKFYLWLIALVLGGMLLHNALDFWRKLRLHYQRQRDAGRSVRMTRNERIQHALLIVAFISLAYTGFALKFPQAWWASPFVGRLDWRSGGHRTAALLFVALSLYHIVYLVFTQRGRKQLRALMPGWSDVVQLGQTLAFALGRRRDRPKYGHYSYIEKMEYWALVWGSIIMTMTGALLTWEGWTMRLFPKWIFDVVTAIHYYEALLACLAILIWHGYFVMFDPDEYPMKWTWATGKASEADEHHRTDAGDPPAEPPVSAPEEPKP